MRIATALFALFLAVPLFAAKEKRIDPQPARKIQQPAVTLDVKDEDARTILKSMQQQCGIKNLVIDPQVQGKATFYFRGVPCSTAFDAVLATFRLKAIVYSDSLTAVERNR